MYNIQKNNILHEKNKNKYNNNNTNNNNNNRECRE